MKKISSVFIVIFLFVITFNSVNAQDCNCTEYLYVNGNFSSEIHKYAINADGSLTEIGVPVWVSGPDFPSPHGISNDLAGNLYIGSAGDNNGSIRKVSCDGAIFPTSDFVIPNTGVYNLESIGNVLYGKTSDPFGVAAWDVCTGASLGSFCFLDANGNQTNDFSWGMNLGLDNRFYVTTNGDAGRIYVFDESDLNGGCIAPLVTNIEAFNNGTGEGPKGITADMDGNIYVVFGGFFVSSHNIAKFDPQGNFITSTQSDSNDGDGGWAGAIGINYSETCDCIYTSNWTTQEDCVSRFDLDLNYLGQAVGAATGASPFTSKASSIVVECCPNNPIQNISETLCVSPGNSTIFLDQVYNCGTGVVCEGFPWQTENADANLSFTDCNATISYTGTGGCITLSKASNGASANATCSAFNISLDVCIYIEPDVPVISVTDNTCEPEADGVFNVDTPCAAGNTLEWSTDGGINWSTTTPVYDAVNSVTVRARCANDLDSTCLSTETADVTSSPEFCCPPENCINKFGEFTITKRRP